MKSLLWLSLFSFFIFGTNSSSANVERYCVEVLTQKSDKSIVEKLKVFNYQFKNLTAKRLIESGEYLKASEIILELELIRNRLLGLVDEALKVYPVSGPLGSYFQRSKVLLAHSRLMYFKQHEEALDLNLDNLMGESGNNNSDAYDYVLSRIDAIISHFKGFVFEATIALESKNIIGVGVHISDLIEQKLFDEILQNTPNQFHPILKKSLDYEIDIATENGQVFEFIEVKSGRVEVNRSDLEQMIQRAKAISMLSKRYKVFLGKRIKQKIIILNSRFLHRGSRKYKELAGVGIEIVYLDSLK